MLHYVLSFLNIFVNLFRFFSKEEVEMAVPTIPCQLTERGHCTGSPDRGPVLSFYFAFQLSEDSK